MSRPLRNAAIAVGVLVFLLISAGLARFLTTENAERDAVQSVLAAQARGDEQGVVAQLAGCGHSAPCVATVRSDVTRLRRPGTVKILSLISHTAYSLTGATGRTRVAWEVSGRLPVVQCVLVRRNGDVVSGISITLLNLSPPISSTGDC